MLRSRHGLVFCWLLKLLGLIVGLLLWLLMLLVHLVVVVIGGHLLRRLQRLLHLHLRLMKIRIHGLVHLLSLLLHHFLLGVLSRSDPSPHLTHIHSHGTLSHHGHSRNDHPLLLLRMGLLLSIRHGQIGHGHAHPLLRLLVQMLPSSAHHAVDPNPDIDRHAPRRRQLPRLQLLLQHWLPNPPPGVGEPVLELFLVDARFLHEEDLILGGGVGMGEVLGREEPGFEDGHGAGGEFAAGFPGGAFAAAGRGLVVVGGGVVVVVVVG
mmetsp:Transcript_19114/g.39403  ORF Transcript_19114/g.39403 Transcript_19114/m.39403 type:complete len:265 (-) Transcript_19114:329-1123(-)